MDRLPALAADNVLTKRNIPATVSAGLMRR